MKKILCALLVILIHSLGAVHSKKAWTVFVYMAADNDLKEFVALNLPQMMKVGSNSALNIVVYLMQKNAGVKTGKKLLIEKNHITVLGVDANSDSGSYDTFLNSVQWAFTEFPADHYAIIGWDHGSGPLNRIFRGVAYDFSTGHYLTDLDIYYALQQISKTILHNNKVDILAFDACLMAGEELAALYAPYVKYMVASQETIPGSGWDYTRALQIITGNSEPDMVAKGWVKAYRDAYASRISDYTLSAVDLSVASDLGQVIDHIGLTLQRLLERQINRSVTQFLRRVTSHALCTGFDEPDYDYLDIDHLFSLMLSYQNTMRFTGGDTQAAQLMSNLTNLLQRAKTLRSQAIIAMANGPEYPHAGGLSIYWSKGAMHPSYAKLGWTQLYPAWAQLIQTYYKQRNP